MGGGCSRVAQSRVFRDCNCFCPAMRWELDRGRGNSGLGWRWGVMVQGPGHPWRPLTPQVMTLPPLATPSLHEEHQRGEQTSWKSPDNSIKMSYLSLQNHKIIKIPPSTPLVHPSAVVDLGDCPVLVEMDVETIGVVVLCHDRAWLDDPRGLGQICLAKCLPSRVSNHPGQPLGFGSLTVSFEGSDSEIFLPTSLFIHSSVLSPEPLDVIPGTTRGMVSVLCG